LSAGLRLQPSPNPPAGSWGKEGEKGIEGRQGKEREGSGEGGVGRGTPRMKILATALKISV